MRVVGGLPDVLQNEGWEEWGVMEIILEVVLDAVVSEVGLPRIEGLGAGFEHCLLAPAPSGFH